MPDPEKSFATHIQKRDPLSGVPGKAEMDTYLNKPDRSDGQLEDDINKAQDLIYDAWEAQDGRRRYAIAKKALKLCPLCADAYVILAGRRNLSPHNRRILFERGVRAGELALGPAAFEELKGEFWGFIETRPYMRARQWLAEELWQDGQDNKAIDHLKDMLVLNPNDNQGVRYILLEWLLRKNNLADLEKFMKEHGNEYSAFMSYTSALLEFRKSGDCHEARRCAKEALETNKFVPVFLLSPKAVPKERDAFYSPGRESEAALYFDQYGFAWQETAGAIGWLVDLMPTDMLAEITGAGS